MTGFDQSQSPRLVQRTPMEASSIQIFSAAEIPEASFIGQMIFRSDTQTIQVYTGSAFQDAVGGVAGLYTFVGPTAPTAINVGDLWFDSANGNAPHRWDGTTWVNIQDAAIAAAMTAAGIAQNTADGKVNHFVSGTAPWADGTTGHALDQGDIWTDTANGNLIKYWDDTTKLWTPVPIGTGGLANDAVTTAKLEADAITAKHTITGALIQTGTGTTSVARMDGTSGFIAYGSTSGQWIQMNASQLIYMAGVANEILGRIDPYDVGSGRPGLSIQSSHSTGWPQLAEIRLVAGSSTTYPNGPNVQLDASGGTVGINGFADIQEGGRCFGTFVFQNDVDFNGNIDMTGTIVSGGPTIQGGPILKGGVQLQNEITVTSLADGADHNTNTGTKYVRCGAAGILWSSTTAPSSREVKHDINELDIDPEQILKLKPKTYRYNDAPDELRAGFIAEEADELGLGLWVGYEDKKNPEKPTGFDYDGYVAALQLVIQNQEQRLQRLEAQVAALTSTA